MNLLYSNTHPPTTQKSPEPSVQLCCFGRKPSIGVKHKRLLEDVRVAVQRVRRHAHHRTSRDSIAVDLRVDHQRPRREDGQRRVESQGLLDDGIQIDELVYGFGPGDAVFVQCFLWEVEEFLSQLRLEGLVLGLG